jgi:hypothetical protein
MGQRVLPQCRPVVSGAIAIAKAMHQGPDRGAVGPPADTARALNLLGPLRTGAQHGDEWNHSRCVVPPFPASSRLGDNQSTPNDLPCCGERRRHRTSWVTRPPPHCSYSHRERL